MARIICRANAVRTTCVHVYETSGIPERLFTPSGLSYRLGCIHTDRGKGKKGRGEERSSGLFGQRKRSTVRERASSTNEEKKNAPSTLLPRVAATPPPPPPIGASRGARHYLRTYAGMRTLAGCCCSSSRGGYIMVSSL